ncbi:hypothetical protein EVAR_53462_1 [Eumeta japonica]|uniref:Histone-lysine N-methyltransferase SETMAR n=1 Tax=Eumeta variegata TaxID=151549 RepID=A0A4C1XRH8_EUMVA|nr:hypothetical protein EVAR_53462_1 [Eumeta japonica]
MCPATDTPCYIRNLNLHKKLGQQTIAALFKEHSRRQPYPNPLGWGCVLRLHTIISRPGAKKNAGLNVCFQTLMIPSHAQSRILLRIKEHRGNSCEAYKPRTSDSHFLTSNTGTAHASSAASSDHLSRGPCLYEVSLGSRSKTFCGLNATLAARNAFGYTVKAFVFRKPSGQQFHLSRKNKRIDSVASRPSNSEHLVPTQCCRFSPPPVQTENSNVVSISVTHFVTVARPPVNDKNIDAVRSMVETDRHVTYHEIRASLRVGMSNIQSILQKHLGMKKLCSQWIPHN